MPRRFVSTRYLLAFSLSVSLMFACGSLSLSAWIPSASSYANLNPVEQTQTAIADQLSQIQMTQAAMEPIQTALASTQSALSTQVAATQTLMANSNPVITRNSDWTPISQVFDGIPYVQVPAGCFEMGSTDEQVQAAIDSYTQETGGDAPEEWFIAEQPPHEQCFDQSFWIMQTEVTNAQYGSVADNCGQYSLDSNQPRNCVTWFEARDYCVSIGGRLPTQREWEYVARGVESWSYPWGDEFVGANVVYDANSGGKTAAVGSRPAGASWVGALDMSGNLWEWTSSLYQPYPYVAEDDREADTDDRMDVPRVLRGGSWRGDLTSYLRGAVRDVNSPSYANFIIGFRCVRDSAP